MSKPLMPVEQARQTLLALAQEFAQPGVEPVELMASYGRVLAQDVVATMDVPPMDNSQMDGYAVRAADVTHSGIKLKVSQRIPAGHMPQPLQEGTAARIFTGAPMPPGADAVVMQEACVAEDDGITMSTVPKVGDWVRPRGFDLATGQVVLQAGRRLNAQDVALIASLGTPVVQCFQRLRVAMFSTGDELRMPGESLAPGQIYNSNRFLLRGLLQALHVEVLDLGIVQDSLDETKQCLRRAAELADVVITCGGVSVGEEDHVKSAVQSEGGLDLWQVAIKPGKPLAAGYLRSAAGRRMLLGLPGNPVSAFVTFAALVRPVLLKMMGASTGLPPFAQVPIAFAWPKADRRTEYLRVQLNHQGRLEVHHNQNSAVLSSTSWADGLAEIPAGATYVPGDTVRYYSFGDLFR